MALGVREQALAGVVDRAALADAGQHVLQRPARGEMMVHVVGRQQRRARRARDRGQVGKALRVVAALQMADGEMQVVTVNYPFFLSDGRKAQFFRVAVSTN
jgi:hypothetical protein